MDIELKKPEGIRKLLRRKNIPYMAGTVLIAAAVWMFFKGHVSELRVDENSIAVAEVIKGEFKDYMMIQGQVEPITSVQLSPMEGGVVKQRLVEEGTIVRKGDPLVVLSNNSLDLSILNAEAELAEKQNFLRNTQVTMEQERLTLRQNKIQYDMDAARKERTYMQNKSLYGDGLIAREVMLQSKEDYELACKKLGLILEKQKQDSIYRKIQTDQMEESLNNMKRNMQLIRRRVGNLIVRSPIDGEVGQLNIELGQSLAPRQYKNRTDILSQFAIGTM